MFVFGLLLSKGSGVGGSLITLQGLAASPSRCGDGWLLLVLGDARCGGGQLLLGFQDDIISFLGLILVTRSPATKR